MEIQPEVSIKIRLGRLFACLCQNYDTLRTLDDTSKATSTTVYKQQYAVRALSGTVPYIRYLHLYVDYTFVQAGYVRSISKLVRLWYNEATTVGKS